MTNAGVLDDDAMLVSVSVVELFVVSMFSHRLGILAKEVRIRNNLLSLVGPLVLKFQGGAVKE